MISFLLNSDLVATDLSPASVLLDVVRREFHQTGTKEGCREGDCGACTVLWGVPVGEGVRYQAVNSCLLPLADVAGTHVVTIEGLSSIPLSPFQLAMVEEGGTQCGFCTPGFILSFTGALLSGTPLTVASVWDALSGNICRCTGYLGIRRAIERALALLPADSAPDLSTLIASGFLPPWILDAPSRLASLGPTHDDTVDNGTLVAGGTDLYVTQWRRLARTGIHSTRDRIIPRGIREDEGRVWIGAATPIEEVRTSPLLHAILPELENALRLFGSPQIRHRATVGGNLVNASPIGDFTCILMALGAKVDLRGSDARILPLRELYLGYKSLALRDGEWVESVTFPLPTSEHRFHFEKVSKRTFLDIATVNSAAWIRTDGTHILDCGLSAGGVAPVPLALTATEDVLRGREVSSELVRDAAAVARSEITPITDVRGSAEYKARLLERLVTCHMLAMFPDRVEGVI